MQRRRQADDGAGTVTRSNCHIGNNVVLSNNVMLGGHVTIGDFVVSGGELPAMLLIDAVVRLQPGALGDDDSAVGESFVDGLLDFPQYTRPREIDGRVVPEVLFSGNHQQIRQWRLQQSLGRTWLRRPDLLADRVMTDEEQRLLAAFKLDLAQQQSNEEDGDGERSHS